MGSIQMALHFSQRVFLACLIDELFQLVLLDCSLQTIFSQSSPIQGRGFQQQRTETQALYAFQAAPHFSSYSFAIFLVLWALLSSVLVVLEAEVTTSGDK